MKVWIETKTGLWGDAEHLVFVDLPDPNLHDNDINKRPLLEFLDLDDLAVARFGRMHGTRAQQFAAGAASVMYDAEAPVWND